MANINVEVKKLTQNLNTEIQALTQDIQVEFSSHILYAYSPSARIDLLENGNYLITITDKDGTTTAEIPVINRENIENLLNEYFLTHPLIEDAIIAHNESQQAHQDIRNLIQAAIDNMPHTPADIGLDQVDNTSDLNKPISIATQVALNLKSNTYIDTTANWALNREISENKAIYIYTDYQSIDDGNGNITYIPGIKIGDGQAYIVDLPFITGNQDFLNNHIYDTILHISNEQRQFWNNKISVYLSPQNLEEMIFTTE